MENKGKFQQNHDASIAGSCCSWRKGTSPDEATLNSEEIKPVAIAIIELHLSEGISKGVSQTFSGRKFD